MKPLVILFTALFLISCQNPKEKQAAELAHIKNMQTVEEFNQFLADNPDTNLRDTIIYYRDKAALDNAVTHNSEAMVIEFLRTYPESAWVEQAHYYLENGFPDPGLGLGLGLDSDTCHEACHGDANGPALEISRPLEDVTKIKTKADYDAFMQKYPDFVWSEDTRYYKEGAILNAAVVSRSEAGVIQFLRDYPDSAWVEQAHYYLEHGYDNPSGPDVGRSKTCHLACHADAEAPHTVVN